MHLVNRHRLVQQRRWTVRAAITHVCVAPHDSVGPARQRGGRRRGLELARVGIALEDRRLREARTQLVLVALALAEPGHEQLPDAVRHEPAHRMGQPMPAVEVADDAHPIGVGGPDREVRAGGVADRQRPRAELLEGAVVRALAEQVQIELAHHLPVAIRIVDLAHEAFGLGDAQAIVEDPLFARKARPRRPRPGAAGSSRRPPRRLGAGVAPPRRASPTAEWCG